MRIEQPYGSAMQTAPRALTAALFTLGLGLVAAPAAAQDAPSDQDAATGSDPSASTDQIIEFSADRLNYDENSDVVEAEGKVVLERDGTRLFSDKVIWNRTTGRVFASGEVKMLSENGDVVYGEDVEISDTLRDGIIENMLIVMSDGGRIAARRGVTKDNYVTLDHAAYTACEVETAEGCPKEPSWQVKADKVYYNPERQRISYDNARIELFGLPVVPLPGLSHSFGKEAQSGLLAPSFGYSNSNGVEMEVPYYFRLAENQDLRVSGHVYSSVAPMASARYRALVDKGAFEVQGYGTYSRRTDLNNSDDKDRGLRGYLAASGQLQFDPYWSTEASIRLASDRTFADRYNINEDDRLRNTVALQKVSRNEFFQIRGWYVQTLRRNDPQDETPIALPLIDYRYRLPEKLAGGQLSLQANSLSILREDGQDSQRAFASARWDRRTLLSGGQQLTFTLFGRGDIYHSDENDETAEALYRGKEGWQARGIAATAIDLEWPLIGAAFGGQQMLSPHIQIVAAPKLKNRDVPNEDSRAVDLEDSNLFSLNRFPGYDRFEDNVRVSFGFDWRLVRDDFTIDATIGQSYRLSNRETIFPDGTGLSDRLSDVVARVEVRWLDYLSVVSRFRLDKENAAVRRVEIDGVVGGRKTYVKAGYLRLNRDISGLEDLQDREELRLAGRLQFARYWAVTGTAVFDLTDKAEDPLSISDGFEALKSRVGLLYDDDCFGVSFWWKRNYERRGDSRGGDDFFLTLSFRNLGR